MSNTEQTGEKFEFSTGLTEVKKILKKCFFYNINRGSFGFCSGVFVRFF